MGSIQFGVRNAPKLDPHSGCFMIDFRVEPTIRTSSEMQVGFAHDRLIEDFH